MVRPLLHAAGTAATARSGAPTSAISITATKHNLQLAMPLATRLTTLAALLMSTGVDAGSSKLPADPDTEHLHTDCWVPDYCEPDKFKYKLCKLRLRNRAKPGDAFACDEDEYCEELDCEHKCWLPETCTCQAEGPHIGRMLCDGKCFKHASTQWGLCTKVPEGWADKLDQDEDEPIPTGFHFYTKDHLLYNAKLHIDEDSPMAAPRVPKAKDEL